MVEEPPTDHPTGSADPRMATTEHRAWLYLGAAIILEVSGSLSLKAALEQPLFYPLVGIGYLGAFACLGLTLRAGMALGVAYGTWGACGVALTAIMSMLLFGDPLTWLMGLGIVLVVGGVLCVEFGAQAARNDAGAL